MPTRTLIRSAALLFAACLWVLPARAQDRRTAPDSVQRIVHVVKHGSAKDLAAVLSKHFQGDAGVEVLPEPNSNCLLIRAKEAVFNDVVKALQALDRRPRLVTVEVWVADVAAKAAEINEKPLTGPAADVLLRLQALQQKGQLGSLRRLRTTVAENQTASFTEGEIKPVVMGTSVTGTGIATRNIVYRNTGTTARCTPHVAEGTVLLELRVEDTRLHVPPDGVVIGAGEKKEPVRATETVLASYTGTVSIAPDRAVLVRDVKVEAKTAGPDRTLVVVTARVHDDNARPAETEVRPLRDRRPRPPGFPPRPPMIGRDPVPGPRVPPWWR